MLVVKDFFFEKLRWNGVTTINIKMMNFDNSVNENENTHNKNWPIIIIGGSESGKTKLLLNLIENQPGIDKIYL